MKVINQRLYGMDKQYFIKSRNSNSGDRITIEKTKSAYRMRVFWQSAAGV